MHSNPDPAPRGCPGARVENVRNPHVLNREIWGSGVNLLPTGVGTLRIAFDTCRMRAGGLDTRSGTSANPLFCKEAGLRWVRSLASLTFPIGDQNMGETVAFGPALHELKCGRRIARDGWNGKDMWIELQYPGPDSKMTLPYIYMRTAQGDLVPWLASQTDLLAIDWRIVA